MLSTSSEVAGTVIPMRSAKCFNGTPSGFSIVRLLMMRNAFPWRSVMLINFF